MKGLKPRHIIFILVFISFISIIFFLTNRSTSLVRNKTISQSNSIASHVYSILNEPKNGFKKYCNEYNISETNPTYISGIAYYNYSLFVAPNDYCSDYKNVSEYEISYSDLKDKNEDYYWTAKIENKEIKEIWVYYKPIAKNQLKHYTYDEQKNMISNKTDDQYKYIIGYYNADEEETQTSNP